MVVTLSFSRRFWRRGHDKLSGRNPKHKIGNGMQQSEMTAPLCSLGAFSVIRISAPQLRTDVLLSIPGSQYSPQTDFKSASGPSLELACAVSMLVSAYNMFNVVFACRRSVSLLDHLCFHAQEHFPFLILALFIFGFLLLLYTLVLANPTS